MTAMRVNVLLFVSLLSAPAAASAQNVNFVERTAGTGRELVLANAMVECAVLFEGDRLAGDRLTASPGWAKEYRGVGGSVETDAGFTLEIMWTDWSAPNAVNNGENPLRLGTADFVLAGRSVRDAGKGKELVLRFRYREAPLWLLVTYRLGPEDYYVRRKLALLDSSKSGHFLQQIWSRDGLVRGSWTVRKKGGFGQPAALLSTDHGVFFGVEYPAADNLAEQRLEGMRVRCGQEIGARIGSEWIESHWVVEGMAPNRDVKLWFMRYVEDIRVAPVKPYTLYNSWYDLRSAEYPRVPPEHVMNEENVLRISRLLRENMVRRHGITLDAFVLDDGWDIYKSDWKLRPVQFPRGLKPVSDDLKQTTTALGIWFGPTGGYSFRKDRIGWMRENNFEVVGDQLCVAGKKYHDLLRTRVTDFVRNDGAGYFKWDGIQFSCSEPDHGHPVGIYSRRAVMEAVADLCGAVREIKRDVYLNITSGTWLSPWWVMYANQIWMQGMDHGYADVPSVSPRDAAITYRDLVLHDDFAKNDFWFPIANLMTHGIIKGRLEMLGGEQEPLDRFTNESLLYFARGVSMWELYVSPDILTDGEWEAMSRSMHWARDRFPVLAHTEMIGGDPGKRETYGYVHYRGARGVIAARNPWIEAGALKVGLDPAAGLDADAQALVVEKVYPERKVLPRLYRAGESFDVPLGGFETAIYEVYPLKDARGPLLAGISCEPLGAERGRGKVALYDVEKGARLLNPETVKGMSVGGVRTTLEEAVANLPPQTGPVLERSRQVTVSGGAVSVALTVDSSVQEGTLALLLTPARGKETKAPPRVAVVVNGVKDTAKFERSGSASTWYTLRVGPGRNGVTYRIQPRDGSAWEGKAEAWLIALQRLRGRELDMDLVRVQDERPMPPRPFSPGVGMRTAYIGGAAIQ